MHTSRIQYQGRQNRAYLVSLWRRMRREEITENIIWNVILWHSSDANPRHSKSSAIKSSLSNFAYYMRYFAFSFFRPH